jgi:hypothetical protein
VRARAGRIAAIGLFCGMLMSSGVALAAGNNVAINLPAKIAAGKPFNYTITGSAAVKGAEHIVVLVYNEADACPASYTSETGLPLLKVTKPAKGHFSVGELGGIGTNANSVSYTCAYVYAQEKGKRIQIASAGKKFTVAATGTAVTVTSG